MRLLKREQRTNQDNAYTYTLTQFNPSAIPSAYGVLSHRWGSDEVTFDDVQAGIAHTRAAFWKLKFCADQAARDGLLYFWIDTCCIDKKSSAELAEAITSMFKWYKNATKCYVCMPDVLTTGEGSHWEPMFRRSEWFTRGWTLQELIAPKVVDFYSFEGTCIGNRKTLEDQIHQITGLPRDVLRGTPPSQFTVEERLTWSEQRQTSVEEDAAYCLVGFFDVQMYPMYGEGKQSAMARLQRKIAKTSDPPIAAPGNALATVPFESNPRFTGREVELAQLEQNLFKPHNTSKTAVIGLGGVGKTQLVLELLYRARERHKDCTIMWILADTNENLYKGYLAVADQLLIPHHADQNTDIVELVQDHLTKLNSGRWLLVFDNADDIDMWMTERGAKSSRSTIKPQRLIDMLPRNQRGSIIFTTRDRKLAVNLAKHSILQVSEMTEGVAMALLQNCLANPELIDQRDDAIALISELTFLPLAITQAAFYINLNDIRVADYLDLLHASEDDVIELLSEDSKMREGTGE